MSIDQSDRPADDPRAAQIIDIKRFLEQDKDPPQTIADALRSDDWTRHVALSLLCSVGTLEDLENLNATPHHDDAFDWSGIDSADRPKITELLALLNAIPDYFDDEYQTIVWRTVRALALDPAKPLERRNRPERIAAAIAWVAFSANGMVGRRYRFKASDLWWWFMVNPCADIGEALALSLRRRAVPDEMLRDDMGMSQGRSPLVADAQLLHSRTRARLLLQRRQLQEAIEDRADDILENRPMVVVDGAIGFRSEPAVVRWASKGLGPGGNQTISIAFGESLDDMRILAVSIPDAHRLIHSLEIALDESLSAKGVV